MKITVKNLQQQTFVVEIGESQTVLHLKEEIQKLKGTEYLVERQKLIYAGVILDDERQLSSYNMDEKKFVVVMVKRDVGCLSSKGEKNSSAASNDKDIAAKKDDSEKQKTADAGNESNISTKDKAVEDEKKTRASDEDADLQSVSREETSSGSSIQIQAESNLLTGQEYEKTVQSIVEMGYSKAMVEQAMVASFNNPERAVEYLISGIPETEVGLLSGAAGNEPQINTRDVDRQISTESSSNSSENPFEFLRTQPQFLQMRSLIHQNPDLLHAVLQQIGQTNPALLQLIYENQEAFLNMLNQPLDDSSTTNPITPAMLPGLANLVRGERSSSDGNDSAVRDTNEDISAGGNNRVEGESNISQREGTTTIRLSPQDQEAIERLKALGFPEVLVLQAYFACEKNEQLAANFLLSSSFDD